MAGKQPVSKGRSAPSRRARNRGPTQRVEQHVPDVYQDMLADAFSSSPTKFGDESRPLKRRKVGPSTSVVESDELHFEEDSTSGVPQGTAENGLETESAAQQGSTRARNPQIAYNESDDSDESEVEWEEVEIGGQDRNTSIAPVDNVDKSLDIVLQSNEPLGKNGVRRKRRPINAEEKSSRLVIHKAHLLCLIAHVDTRNQMCNDDEAQAVLKSLVSRKTTSYLNPARELSQFQQTRSFTDGLTQANELWKAKFYMTARGMRNASWAESEGALRSFKLPEDIDPPVDLNEFRNLARKLEGSRDLGTQLFCSLLRSVGVTARLVCSLQPLPFTTASRPTVIPPTRTDFVIAESDAHDTASGEESAGSWSKLPATTPRKIRRIGQPGSTSSSHVDLGKPPPVQAPRRKHIMESPYPIYWVEAFNKASQKWIPVEPLVTNTVSKPSKFEPPASDAQNNMSYVLAFEEDGSAVDVTRRYVKYYNAKTRRNRVEATKDGERWWKKTTKALRRGWDLDRDQIEDAELAAKEASEKMPQNVLDFKNHPYYVLERHLRRNEVIHPRREVGKVSASKSLTSSDSRVLESIFRRRDVQVLKSGDGWYRVGREIKPGEQPLKLVRPRAKRIRSVDDDAAYLDDEGQSNVGMYAEFQTDFYVPPPVVGGRVPKNEFGNLDMYVPSMVPLGGVHLPHPEAARAARTVAVDYADAVTGFEFRGRHGTAVVKGIVVAEEYREAIEAIIERFQDDRIEAEEQRRSLESLRMWKRFMAGLRIRERIEGYAIEGAQNAIGKKMDDKEAGSGDNQGGGFFPDGDQEVVAEPTAKRVQGEVNSRESFEGGGFLAEEPNPIAANAVHFGARLDNVTGAVLVQPTHHDLELFSHGSGSGSNADTNCIEETKLEYDGSGFLSEDAEAGTQGPVRASETIDNGTEVLEDTDVEKPVNPDSIDGIAALTTPQRTAANDISENKEHENSANKINDGHRGQSPGDSSLDLPGSEVAEPASDTDSIDKGSLLSQDPEDDDADPEWLAGS